MRVLIVDDNKVARLAMKNLVKQVETLELAGECASAVEAVNFLNRQQVDLLLLDVEMPEMSGIDLIKHLKNCPLVILSTAKKEYAVDAFEQRVVDYLVKPVLLPRFIKAIERAREIFDNSAIASASEDHFFVRHEGVWIKIGFDQILFIQALADYATIATPQAKYTIHTTMKALEDKLPANKFLRIHRSYIVALAKITKVSDGMVYLAENKPIPIADSYKAQLMEKLNFL